MRWMLAGKIAALCAASVLLGACAHPQLVDMGQTNQQVVSYLGAPDASTKMPDGTTRLTYSMQPFGEEVWWLFFDKDGKLFKREQGLQEKYFSQIQVGKWTEADVFAFWGRCAQKYEFHLANEHAWMYRYRDDGGFYMAVWPQFDTNGIVRSVETTTDPWRDNDRNPLIGF